MPTYDFCTTQRMTAYNCYASRFSDQRKRTESYLFHTSTRMRVYPAYPFLLPLTRYALYSLGSRIQLAVQGSAEQIGSNNSKIMHKVLSADGVQTRTKVTLPYNFSDLAIGPYVTVRSNQKSCLFKGSVDAELNVRAGRFCFKQ